MRRATQKRNQADRLPGNMTLDELIGRNLHQLRASRALRQDDVAQLMRRVGADWTRVTVSSIERGARSVSVAELILLSLAFQTPMEAFVVGSVAKPTDSDPDLDPDLLSDLRAFARITEAADQGQLSVGLLPRVAVDDIALKRVFRSADEPFDLDRHVAVGDPVDPLIANTDVLRLFKLLPSVEQLERAYSAARNDAEMRVAAKLDTDPFTVSAAAYAHWGRSLTEERDDRVAREAGEDASARTLQAVRGHVTRSLISELEPLVRKEA